MLPLSVVPFWWLMVMPGWPVNHEWLRIFRRMGIYAGQWRLGHWMPVWSTTAFDGYGSPSPIIYHKVFNILSTTVWLLTGAPKTSICLSLILVMLVGCLGAAHACRRLLGRADLAIEATAAMLLAFATYTTTDWVMRGAVAEFCALVGVAWLFSWCLTLIAQGRFGWWIGPLMAALCLAHTIIAVVCLVPFGLSLGLAAIGRPRAWREWIAPACLAACVGAAILAPVLLAVPAYVPYVAMKWVPLAMKLGYNHFDFMRLFYEPHWHWGDAPLGLTLQIDPLLLAFAAGAALLCAISRRRRLEGLFLVGVVAIMIGLQSDQARPIFLAVPLMWWLQFTYRLLTFVTVALCLCGALVLAWVQDRTSPRVTLAILPILALAMSLGKPWLGAHSATLYYSDAQIQSAIRSETLAPEPGEYTPRSMPGDPFSRASGWPDQTGPCQVRALDDMTVERAKARFAVACSAPGIATLPLFLGPGMHFRADGLRVPPDQACKDGRVRLAMSGHAVVEVIFPTWLDAVAISTGLAQNAAKICPDG